MKSTKAAAKKASRSVQLPFRRVQLPPVIFAATPAAIRAMIDRYERNRTIAAIFGDDKARSPVSH